MGGRVGEGVGRWKRENLRKTKGMRDLRAPRSEYATSGRSRRAHSYSSHGCGESGQDHGEA